MVGTAESLSLKFGAMTVRFTKQDTVARVDCGGLVTGKVLHELTRELPRLFAAPPPGVSSKAFVVSFSGAVLVSAPTLNSLLENIPRDSLLRMPAAVIVPPGVEDAFQQHAWDVAQNGILRAVFTDAGHAQAWAARRAGL